MDRKMVTRLRLLQYGGDENKQRYTEERNYYKQVCRRKKIEWTQEKLSQIDENYKNKVIRNFYQDVKKQQTGYQHKRVYYKNKTG